MKNLSKKYFSVLEKFDSSCWIAGGAITDYLTGNRPMDIDIFFSSEKDKNKAVSKMIRMGARKMADYYSVTRLKYKNVMHDLSYLGGTPEKCITQFDYTVCCVAIDKNDDFYYHENYFKHVENKEIHYLGNHPNMHFIGKSKRLKRYINKGYSMDNENLLVWLDRLEEDQKKLWNKIHKPRIKSFKIKKIKVKKV